MLLLQLQRSKFKAIEPKARGDDEGEKDTLPRTFSAAKRGRRVSGKRADACARGLVQARVGWTRAPAGRARH